MDAEKRKAWLVQRHGYLTASDVPAVLGVNKYKTLADVIQEKVDASEEDNVPSVQARLGTLYEPMLLDALAEYRSEWDPWSIYRWVSDRWVISEQREPLSLDRAEQGLVVDKGGFLAATVDDTVLGTPVEVKHTIGFPYRPPGKSAKSWWDVWRDSGKYLGYALQCQAQMACTGADAGLLIVVTGTTPTGYVIPRCEATVAKIRDAARDVMQRVRSRRDGV